ncbi:MAG: DUF389 domain-containing protein [Lentimicrobium sp.]|nr:DUF389 domain-containing protein [Lentimicrobium sp.]
MSRFREFIHLVRLDGEVEDFKQIHQTIEKDIVFKGTNLWILVFAIIIASVGLNMNSTAVIIGAMLISPLMGPINGLGYSIATYNMPLFRSALKNFGFAVGAGLVASTGYFALSPVATAHSELLARTSPTIYDVLIALFGGLAGIVAISSRNKGNVIPGVAIATALMPPLCTAGYGLATAQFQYFLGALYLFTINTVFIALAAVLVSQLLNFPITTIVQESEKTRINQWISFVIFITIIPSIYFGYGLVQKERFTENVARFTRNVTVFEGSYLLRHESNPSKKELTLTYGGNLLTEAGKATLREKAKDFSLEKSNIDILQGFSFNDEGNTEAENLKLEISTLRSDLFQLNREKDSLIALFNSGETLLRELNAVFPYIIAGSYAESRLFSLSGDSQKVAQVTFQVEPGKLRNEDKEKIQQWLQQRLKTDKVKVYYEEVQNKEEKPE